MGKITVGIDQNDVPLNMVVMKHLDLRIGHEKNAFLEFFFFFLCYLDHKNYISTRRFKARYARPMFINLLLIFLYLLSYYNNDTENCDALFFRDIRDMR